MSRLTPLGKRLRKNSTDTENFLWNRLRAKRFGHLKFRRQVPMGPYIADFVCFEKRVVIECDGGQHMEQRKKDELRDQWFRNRGYCVLRFWDNQVLREIEVVLEEIDRACTASPPPSPSRKGRGKFRFENLP